jgi:UDP-glucose 4-epimerase
MSAHLAPHARVMITDGDTPLASALGSALLARERTARVVHVLSREPARSASDPRVTHLSGDLTRERPLRALLFGAAARHAVDTLVHGCGPVSARALADPAGIASLRTLLALCEEHPTIQRFVLVSSWRVYRRAPQDPALLDEDHPLALHATGSRWRKLLVEADVTAGLRVARGRLEVRVLRLAEVFAPGCDGPLSSLRGGRACATALGFDPIVELLSLEDAARAITLACTVESAPGVFNVPGRDVLPLSVLLASIGLRAIPLPTSWLPAWTARYGDPEVCDDGALALLRHGGVLDGRRVAGALGYAPRVAVPLFAPRPSRGPARAQRYGGV